MINKRRKVSLLNVLIPLILHQQLFNILRYDLKDEWNYYPNVYSCWQRSEWVKRGLV